MTDSLDFADVFSLVRGALSGGRLKINKTGIVFKSQKTGKVDSIPLAEIESSEWMRVARGFGLKIILKNGQNYKYHGFKEVEYEKLKDFYSKNYEIAINEVDMNVSGWNWGTPKFKGAVMSFEVADKPAFEIPLKDVSQATTGINTGKNEVTIEFHRNDDSKVTLMEMRFFVPANQDEDGVDPVKAFQDQILAKADIIQATGDAIVTFSEVACLTPRGRYSIRVYPTFLQLHGKTYDYKIPHTTVLRLFLLPHQDNRFMFFVISMDPPLRQGQTRYPFLILQFERDEEMTCKLNLTEDEIENKYNNKLSQEMSGSIFEVVSRVLKEICQKKITVPGSFKSVTGTSAITCSYKASSGLLYPLERGFIFVHKPPIHIRFDEITAVNFARGSTTGRTFDFECNLKNGTEVIFSSLPREEYTPLFDFVNSKKLRIKNKGGKSGASNLDQMIESDDDEHDAYLRQVKAEGAERDDDDDDDSDSSEDEDFNPANEKVEDVDEEFDSDITVNSDTSSDSDDDEEEKEKKKKKKEKRKSESKHREPKAKRAKTESGSTRKKGSKKDKNAPKRPMSAYMLFLGEKREQIKKDNPDITFTDIPKRAGEMWKALTDKTKYEEMAKEAKVKYEQAMKEYQQKLKESGDTPVPSSSKKSTVKSKSIKDMMKKNTSKSSSSTAYKSKEYISDDDTSSDDDDDAAASAKKSKSPAASPKKSKSPSASPERDESSPEKEGSKSPSSSPEKEGSKSPSASPEKPAAKATRSSRSKPGKEEELVELDENSDAPSEDEAEFSGEQSSDGGDSD